MFLRHAPKLAFSAAPTSASLKTISGVAKSIAIDNGMLEQLIRRRAIRKQRIYGEREIQHSRTRRRPVESSPHAYNPTRRRVEVRPIFAPSAGVPLT